MQMAADTSGDVPLLPAYPSPDEIYSEYDEAKLSKIRKLFCSHTWLFLVLGLLLLAFLLVTALVLPDTTTTTTTTKLPPDPLARARALMKQSPLIDGYD